MQGQSLPQVGGYNEFQNTYTLHDVMQQDNYTSFPINRPIRKRQTSKMNRARPSVNLNANSISHNAMRKLTDLTIDNFLNLCSKRDIVLVVRK